ncbi:MAG: hypothetical protein GY782_04205 [Gammaproteobacteria bacterium]|nr:hypothetical protein [Gammaproteobacteria bacterium]
MLAKHFRSSFSLFPESDRDHPFSALEEAVQLSNDTVVRFAATFCQSSLTTLTNDYICRTVTTISAVSLFSYATNAIKQ